MSHPTHRERWGPAGFPGSGDAQSEEFSEGEGQGLWGAGKWLRTLLQTEDIIGTKSKAIGPLDRYRGLPAGGAVYLGLRTEYLGVSARSALC